LFKLGLAILKINEPGLLGAHGDEMLLPSLRTYFKSLGSEDQVPEDFDFSTIRLPPNPILLKKAPAEPEPLELNYTGYILCDHLFQTAFQDFAGVTMDKLEALRVRQRLRVVQQM
jgi:hypothetical protein